MNLYPLLDDFLRHIRFERNLSHHTTSQYRRDLSEWLKYLEHVSVPADTEAITTPVMRRWLQDMAESGRRPPTVTRKLCCLRSFWKFLRRYHEIEHDPMSTLIAPKIDRKLPETLKRSEVVRLFEACEESHYRVHRVGDKAIIAVLSCLGLRRQELIDVRIQDFNVENRTLLVRSAKRGRERLVPLTEDLISFVTAWLSVRPQAEDDHLFVTRHGTPLNPNRLEEMLGRLARQAGMDRRPNLHMFRHYAGTSIVQQGGLERGRRLLGHRSPETTAIYTHLSVDDLRSAVDETAVRSGMTTGFRTTASTMELDPATEIALHRLGLAVGGLAEGWRQHEEVLRELVSRWAAETASGTDDPYGIQDVEQVLWARAAVPGLGFDDQLIIANFGHVARSHLALCQDRPPHVRRLPSIGQELAHGLASVETASEGVGEEQLTKATGQLLAAAEEEAPVDAIVRGVRLYTSLQPFRVDIPHGRQAIDVMTGLAVWSVGLPPLIIPASERQLWSLLVGRFLSGDGVPIISYATAKLKGLVERIHAVLIGR